MQYLYMIICHMVNTHKLCLCTNRNRLFKANRLMAPPAKINAQLYYIVHVYWKQSTTIVQYMNLTKSYLLTLLYLAGDSHKMA